MAIGEIKQVTNDYKAVSELLDLFFLKTSGSPELQRYIERLYNWDVNHKNETKIQELILKLVSLLLKEDKRLIDTANELFFNNNKG